MARSSIYPPSVTPGIPHLGKRPDGWLETTYGDILEKYTRKAEIQDEQKYQLVTAKRSRGGIVPRSQLYGKEIKTEAQFYICTDDFLISKRQIIHGACGIVPAYLDGAIVSGEYSVLRVKPGLLLDYLKYHCHTVYFQQTCFQSSVGVDVEKMIFDLEQWLKYKVYLPTPLEQRKIADILTAWDEVIDLTKRLIVAAQRRKQALIQRLLIGKLRFPDFNDEWNEFPVHMFIERGNAKFDPQKEDENMPCVELEHIAQKTGKLLGSIPVRNQQSIKNRFEAGQVLFGKLRPYLRKYAKPDFDGVCSSEIWVLSGKDNLCTNEYLFFLVQSHDFIAAANATSGTKMPRADWYHLSLSVFLLPLPDEQIKISEMLIACDEEIEALQQKLTAIQQQKQGLMQQLLTGKIRVKV